MPILRTLADLITHRRLALLACAALSSVQRLHVHGSARHVERTKASSFVAAVLQRHGIEGAAVADPAPLR